VGLLSPLAARAVVAAASLAALTASTAGCARLHARAIGPALQTPAPPARVVPTATEPIESQPIVASPPVPEVQPPAPVAIKPQQETPPPAPAPAAPPPAPPVVAERPAPPPAEPPPTLQTTNTNVAEQRTRVSLANATRDLGRIDIRALSTDAKAQYDMARRFIAQATEALNAKNFEFAQQLADKAATLAALLQKR
jgi:outer membrane biosynthesis protein TonB